MSDLRALSTELNTLKTIVDNNADVVTELSENIRWQLSEQNRRIEGVEASMNTLRTDLENKIAHSQTVILSAIGAVGVVLAAIQLLT